MRLRQLGLFGRVEATKYKTMILHATINERGEVIFNSPPQAHTRLKSLSGKKVVVEVEEEKTTRSVQQNKYLWSAIYGTLAEETGNSEDVCHEFCKAQFLPIRIVEVLGKAVKLKGSTAKLSSYEFTEYIEKIFAYFADFGITFPIPDMPEEYEVEERVVRRPNSPHVGLETK